MRFSPNELSKLSSRNLAIFQDEHAELKQLYKKKIHVLYQTKRNQRELHIDFEKLFTGSSQKLTSSG